ncbi:MAG: serine/threonine-protein kinase [bacterium]
MPSPVPAVASIALGCTAEQARGRHLCSGLPYTPRRHPKTRQRAIARLALERVPRTCHAPPPTPAQTLLDDPRPGPPPRAGGLGTAGERRQPRHAHCAAAGAGSPSTEQQQATMLSTGEAPRSARYRLGAGAMGTVFAAHDERLDRAVAIKVLRDRGAAAAARMLREARALARLSHPHVVTVHEVGTEGDRTFIVMEFVPGPTLMEWQRGRPWRAVLQAYVDAGRGLAAVHAAGLVHRDFKPSNVLVGQDGRVRVADFGLVRAESAEPAPVGRLAEHPDQRMTASGALVGTPAYMAPEQLRGAGADKSSDLFAFCSSLHEALAGSRPFPGRGIEAVLARMDEGPPALPRPIPAALGEVVARGLATDPAQRWPSMPALLDALEAAAHRRPPWLLLGAALAGLGLVATLALWPEPTARPPEPPEPTEPTASVADPRPPALRARPEISARLLAVRGEGEAWRQAALEVLNAPLTDVAFEPGRGPVSEVRPLGPGDLLVRFMDGTAGRWRAGALEPWPSPRLPDPCRPPDRPDAAPWPASFSHDAEGAVACRPDGLVLLGPGEATLYPFEGPPRRLRDLPAGQHLLAPGGEDVLSIQADGSVLRTGLASPIPPRPSWASRACSARPRAAAWWRSPRPMAGS